MQRKFLKSQLMWSCFVLCVKDTRIYMIHSHTHPDIGVFCFFPSQNKLHLSPAIPGYLIYVQHKYTQKAPLPPKKK